jgi:hypothetical protein
LFQGVTDAYLADRDFALIGYNPLQYFERRVGANFDGRSKRFELFFIEWQDCAATVVRDWALFVSLILERLFDEGGSDSKDLSNRYVGP